MFTLPAVSFILRLMIHLANALPTPQSVEFGGPLDGTLAAVALGSLAVGEFTPYNSVSRYIAAGVAAVAGTVLGTRMWLSGR